MNEYHAHDERIANENNVEKYACPCKNCIGGNLRRRQVFFKHMLRFGHSGISPFPQNSYPNRIPLQSMRDVEAPNIDEEASNAGEHATILDEGIEVDRMMNEGFKDDWHKLMEDASKPVYGTSKLSHLSTILLILNLQTVHGWTNESVDELLTFLQQLLPLDSTLPKKRSACKAQITKLGLGYENIHTCVNGCVLFHKNNASETECPKCKKPRYRPGLKSNSTPRKILRHFPVIPRLLRMYRCRDIAELMQWHAQNKSTDGKQRSMVDSKMWMEFDNKWPDFSQEPRNIRLGLALHGVNPFSDQSTKWSTWPVFLINYNLPPWLATKSFFLMLSLIIPGKKSVNSETIDVYLEPLFDELAELWKGIEAIQILRDNDSIQFTLRASLLLTIHDLPAYGTLTSLTVHGYHGCPACIFKPFVRHSISLRKCIYCGHHAYLKMELQYRRQKSRFNGQEENREAPSTITSDYIIQNAEKRMQFIENGGILGSKNDPLNGCGVKRLCIFYKLPYFKHITIRHTVDFMHTEKNIAFAIIETLFGAYDTVSSRLDLQELKIRRNLWVEKYGDGKYRKPIAPYVWTKEQCAQFLTLMSQTRFPTRYVSSNVRRKTDSNGLRGLKTHDYHVIIEDILPIAVISSLQKGPRLAIIRLGLILKRMSMHVLDPSNFDNLREEVVEVLCLLEREFAPTIFNISMHLLIHLEHELEHCGPIRTRWMYPIERYMKVLKKFVRNKAKPGGSMCEGYSMQEAIGFCTEYMKDFSNVNRRVWDDDEDKRVAGEVLEGNVRCFKLSNQERTAIHAYVLQNTSSFDKWRR